MEGIVNLIEMSREFGIFHFYLPFVLSFGIIYGILDRIKLFGTEKTGKRINLMVSGLLALFIISSTQFGLMFAEYIGSLFTESMLVIVTLLGTMMILYVMGQIVGVDIPAQNLSKTWGAVLLMVALLLGAGVFISSGGLAFIPGADINLDFVNQFFQFLGIAPTYVAIIIMFVGTIWVFWWITQEDKSEGGKK